MIFVPTRRLALCVLIGAPVWLFSGTPIGMRIAIGTSILFLMMVVIDAIRMPSARHITLTRSLPATVGVGDTTAGTYHVVSQWPGPILGTVAHVFPSLVDETLSRPEFHAALDHPAEIAFTVTGRTRGTAPLGITAVIVQSPWHLLTRTYRSDLHDTITVLPSISNIRRYRLQAIQHRLQTTGSRALRRHVGTTAFANLREYTLGDDPRHIDWKASARHQRLISREFTVEQGQTIMIAIDAGRMMTQLAGDRSRFEYALSSALILADVALQAGDRVGLMVFNDEVRQYVTPSRGPKTLLQIRDALAGVTATMTEPDYAAAFRTLLESHRRRSLIVLFTDVIDTRSSRAIVAHTVRSATRHLPLVVALRNDQLTQTATPSTDATHESAYATVAAEELLSARHEVLLGMRQAGVAVLDTPPTAMTAAVINRYLEIKDRALL